MEFSQASRSCARQNGYFGLFIVYVYNIYNTYVYFFIYSVLNVTSNTKNFELKIEFDSGFFTAYM